MLFKNKLSFLMLILVLTLLTIFLVPPAINADTQRVWVDTSHWETGYKYIEDWVPCDITYYGGTDSYGWAVYSFCAKHLGYFEGSLYGQEYRYKLYEIDYRPHFGGRVHIFKYECYEVLTKKRVAYKKWVEEGHWEDYTESVWINEDDYEHEHGHKHVDSAFHGELIVKKDPEYVFTKWHKDKYNNECSMNLSISWEVDNSNLPEGEVEKKIVRLFIYEDVCRFDDKGIERVIIFDGNISPSAKGDINTVTKFEYSGSKESLLHIYLFDQNGESAHVCFSNPINGFRSINLMPEGSSTDANAWLGGISYEKFEF